MIWVNFGWEKQLDESKTFFSAFKFWLILVKSASEHLPRQPFEGEAGDDQ